LQFQSKSASIIPYLLTINIMGTPDSSLGDHSEVLPTAQVEVGSVYPLGQLQPHMEFRLVNPPEDQPHLQGFFQLGPQQGHAIYMDMDETSGCLKYSPGGKWCYVPPETEVEVVHVPSPETGLVH
jgi:hypothetical protein